MINPHRTKSMDQAKRRWKAKLGKAITRLYWYQVELKPRIRLAELRNRKQARKLRIKANRESKNLQLVKPVFEQQEGWYK